MGTLPAEAISQAAELIRNARHVVVLTGAGISVPSGVPDFRTERTGLWEKDDPMEVASLTTFRRQPEKFFNWLRPLAEQMQAAQPNPAHLALAMLEQRGNLQAIITQNIDGLHQRAGSKTVIEVHGSANTMTCPKCRSTYATADFQEVFLSQKLIPRCPHCAVIVKPDIILFEEMLPASAWEKAFWHSNQADVMLVVGSSLTVAPAGNLPYHALQNSAKLLINTLSMTPLDPFAAWILRRDASEVLPKIVEALQ